MNILENISLKKYNTFGVDADADYFVEIKSENELHEVTDFIRKKNLNKLILGGGSNILFTGDYHGIVIRLSIPGIKIIDEDSNSVLVEAGAGVIWHSLVKFCIDRNMAGIENLSLIPGTVGAAPIQNIGAYGQELKNVFEYLNGFSLEDDSMHKYYKNECMFGYRESIFKRDLKGKFIITKVVIRLDKNPKLNLDYGTVKAEVEKLKLKKPTVKDISNIISSIRKSKLPDPALMGNAGSFFKNPLISQQEFSELKKKFPDIPGYNEGNLIKLSAGKLIEVCGWRGKRAGNTGAYPKQALVLVNYGGASGKEILNLAEDIKNSVYKKFGILLTEEVNIY